ncbi:MAG TPA: VRR-NUC domain-containing protein [Candidatus Dormibacteraeota bacterium]|nr:VRR-NUC domain-containing protein [Candidatus Dormibacteraeota bacterium]
MTAIARDGQRQIALAMTERDLQWDIVSLATALGWRCFHAHDARRSAAGFPDLCLARRGDVLFAELKTERGRLSNAQIAWSEELPNWFCWRPTDWLSGAVQDALR